MDENIINYRQPMVTAIGIILGFALGFTGKWATEPVEQSHWTDIVICFGLFSSIILLIIALYRVLNNKLPKENVGEYYQKTLKLFIIGITLVFLGMLISIFQTILF